MSYPKLSALKTLLAHHRRDGCAWTRAQNMTSLIPKTIEEIYELEEAINKNDWASIREELGDLLYHILFYAEIAYEQGQFDFDDLANIMLKKHEQRMPDIEAMKSMNAEETNDFWQKSKAKLKKMDTPFSNIPPNLPTLNKAMKIQEIAADRGFDWTEPSQVISKIREELLEIEAEIEANDQDKLLDECGDLLFAVINLTRKCGGHPETALSRCNQRFRERFGRMDEIIRLHDKTWQDYSLHELEELWQRAKKDLN